MFGLFNEKMNCICLRSPDITYIPFIDYPLPVDFSHWEHINNNHQRKPG